MANVVEQYQDGRGNILAGVRWDGDPVTAQTIAQWSNNQATVDKRGVLGVIINGTHVRQNVGIGDWVCMDGTQSIFPLTNSQMQASYLDYTPPVGRTKPP